MIDKELKTDRLSVIDLFSGAGGFSLAALNCELNVIAAIELDKNASQTYQNNIVEKRSTNTKLYSEDILKIDAAAFRKELNLNEGDLDLLVGGPPCQGFSTHRINGKGVDDPRNQLLLRYFDFVKELKPKLFLVENVPGLLWKRHESYLEEFSDLARQHGYKMLDPVKLNAKNYGVPQNRQRVFILGIRTDLDATDLQWPPVNTHFAPNKGKPEWENASAVFDEPPAWVLDKLTSQFGKEKTEGLKFGQTTENQEHDSSAVHMQHTEALIKRFRLTPVNGGREDIDFRLPCHDDEYKGHRDVYGRIRLAQPGPTITTGCFNPSKGRFLHPWLNHGITIRHAARFQTFPEDFVFSSGITSQGKQVGNAVPVKLAEHLITSLKSFIIKSFQHTDKE